MTNTIERDTPRFTRTLTDLAALGAAFGLDPDEDAAADPVEGVIGPVDAPPAAGGHPPCGDTNPDAVGDGPAADPLGRLAAVKALGAALAARREHDREERAAAFRELAEYDGTLAAIRGLEADLGEARAARAGFEEALARPFDDPAWIYDQGLRDDYAAAVAEATATEAALAALIAERRREAERLAAAPGVARLLAARRRHEEAARAKENAAEANRRRSLALASAVSLRDAGSFEEARRVLGPVASRYPDDPETRSVALSIDLAEAAVKDAAAAAALVEARRLRRADPERAAALIAAIDTATLSADRMHEVAGVAVDIAKRRPLVNPRFLRGRAPNSLAIVAEERGRWEVAVAVGQDPALRAGNVVPPRLAATAPPLHARK